MTYYIYIRHAEKAYSNGKGPQHLPKHDPPITEKSIESIQEIGSKLIKEYGIPDLIITSPYLRVQQTVEYLTSSIKKNINDKVHIDLNIAEYLGHQKDEIDLTETTLDLINYKIDKLPQPGETMTQLKERIVEHMRLVQLGEDTIKNEKTPDIIWIVTHGLIIKNVYSVLKSYKDLSDVTNSTFYPNELGYFILSTKDNKLEILI